ncbi:MAG: DUF2059 domain-containing protein [Thiotrichaceae bacterium]|nr:DUF2059 domain-containing protein [Thiotrichaceae bacterium]PCI12111.1 MAG: hypothetical protein COB71_10490 [Thiotrichales bacterium]
MMRKLSKLMLTLVLFGFSAVSISAESNKAALVLALMQQSGMNMQIELIPAQVKAGIRDSARQGVPMDVVIQDKLVGALDTQSLNQSVQDYMAEEMSVDEMRQVLSWLASPLGKRVVAMERLASQPDTMMKMFEAYKIEQARPGRLERIQRIDEAVLSKERTKDLMVNIQIFFGMAMAAESGSMQRASYGQTRYNMEQAMAPMWGELEQVVTMMYLFTYQGLSDAELDQYIEFTASPVGRKYNQVLYEGLSDAFSNAGKSLRQSLKSACRSRQKGCDGMHPYPLV